MNILTSQAPYFLRLTGWNSIDFWGKISSIFLRRDFTLVSSRAIPVLRSTLDISHMEFLLPFPTWLRKGFMGWWWRTDCGSINKDPSWFFGASFDFQSPFMNCRSAGSFTSWPTIKLYSWPNVKEKKNEDQHEASQLSLDSAKRK